MLLAETGSRGRVQGRLGRTLTFPLPFFHLLTGILTKPDLVDKGTEKVIVNVVQNLTYRLKKGYMIVRCRGQQEVTDRLSLEEATRKEAMFFQAHPYFRWDSVGQPWNGAPGWPAPSAGSVRDGNHTARGF